MIFTLETAGWWWVLLGHDTVFGALAEVLTANKKRILKQWYSLVCLASHSIKAFKWGVTVGTGHTQALPLLRCTYFTLWAVNATQSYIKLNTDSCPGSVWPKGDKCVYFCPCVLREVFSRWYWGFHYILGKGISCSDNTTLWKLLYAGRSIDSSEAVCKTGAQISIF